MLLTPPGREEAIRNIIRAAGEGRFHDKTEPFDPVLSPEELSVRIRDHIQRMHSPASRLKNLIARGIAEIWRRRYSVGTDRIEGAEKLEGIRSGAFLTSNHFNPFDNGVIRTLSRETGHGRLWALSQGTNFVMPGLNGFMLRHSDVIPLLRDPSYMAGPLREMMRKVLDKKHFILIYPEQEMWFNYRKPRPGKRGAYLFAAEMGVPVIPCFVQMEDRPGRDAAGWQQIALVLHVLDPIWPDPAKTPRQNSFEMCMKDYAAKTTAYEKAYGRPLNYDFDLRDIAGWQVSPPAGTGSGR